MKTSRGERLQTIDPSIRYLQMPTNWDITLIMNRSIWLEEHGLTQTRTGSLNYTVPTVVEHPEVANARN